MDVGGIVYEGKGKGMGRLLLHRIAKAATTFPAKKQIKEEDFSDNFISITK